jgi:hypothetical protein
MSDFKSHCQGLKDALTVLFSELSYFIQLARVLFLKYVLVPFVFLMVHLLRCAVVVLFPQQLIYLLIKQNVYSDLFLLGAIPAPLFACSNYSDFFAFLSVYILLFEAGLLVKALPKLRNL